MIVEIICGVALILILLGIFVSFNPPSMQYDPLSPDEELRMIMQSGMSKEEAEKIIEDCNVTRYKRK